MKRNDYGYISKDGGGFKSGDEWIDWLFPVCIGLILVFALVALFMCFSPKEAHAETVTLKASWYSVESLKKEGTWKYSKGVMANGKKFVDEEHTCACRLYPLGTTLRITNLRNKKTVTVKVTDRISKRFAQTRIDLSRGSFEQIADLKEGLVPISVEVV